MVAAAKALADSARESQVLEIRGGVLQGRTMTAAEVEALATLPPLEMLRGQVLGAIIAPLTALAGARERTAPEPRRPDRRSHRAARRRGRGSRPEAPAAEEPGCGRGAGGRGRRGGRRAAEGDGPTTADATASASETDNDTETTED